MAGGLSGNRLSLYLIRAKLKGTKGEVGAIEVLSSAVGPGKSSGLPAPVAALAAAVLMAGNALGRAFAKVLRLFIAAVHCPAAVGVSAKIVVDTRVLKHNSNVALSLVELIFA